MSQNSQTCACITPQYAPVVFDSVAYQNGANTIYNAKAATVAASLNGTLSSPNGNPTFKSDYERMQYLLGKKAVGGTNGGVCGGVRKKVVALGTN
jgi:hypothetical protein